MGLSTYKERVRKSVPIPVNQKNVAGVLKTPVTSTGPVLVHVMMHPEQPQGNPVTKELKFVIDGKEHIVKCVSGKVETEKDEVFKLLVKYGWIHLGTVEKSKYKKKGELYA